MKKYGLHGKLQAKSGKGDELAKILLEAATLVSTTKGCHLYIISQDAENTDALWVTEVWDSQEDHDNSLTLESVRALIGLAMPLLDGRPESGQRLTVLGGAGL